MKLKTEYSQTQKEILLHNLWVRTGTIMGKQLGNYKTVLDVDLGDTETRNNPFKESRTGFFKKSLPNLG